MPWFSRLISNENAFVDFRKCLHLRSPQPANVPNYQNEIRNLNIQIQDKSTDKLMHSNRFAYQQSIPTALAPTLSAFSSSPMCIALPASMPISSIKCLIRLKMGYKTEKQSLVGPQQHAYVSSSSLAHSQHCQGWLQELGLSKSMQPSLPKNHLFPDLGGLPSSSYPIFKGLPLCLQPVLHIQIYPQCCIFRYILIGCGR